MKSTFILILVIILGLGNCTNRKKSSVLWLMGLAASGSKNSISQNLDNSSTNTEVSTINNDNNNNPTYEPSGSFDSTFGTNGFATKIDYTSDFIVNGVAYQSDGKILLVGKISDDFATLRFNSNGSLDTNFGSSGEVITNINANDEAFAVAVQSDGKIVVAGNCSNGNGIAVVRYNTDGTLDSSFGSGGIIQISGMWPSARSVQIQNDGKIVVSGYENISWVNQFITYRLNTDGTLDTSFGSGGKVTTAFGTDYAEAYSNVLQPDGKIVLVGEVQKTSGSDFAVVRYNSDGSLDTSFNSTGIIDNTDISNSERGNVVQIQNDGKIVVAGYSNVSGNKFAIIRYNTDGSLDSSFGTSGIVTLNFPSSSFSAAYSMVIQSNGKILVGGETNQSGYSYFAITRLLTDGSVDTTFGQSGYVVEKIFTHPNTTSYGVRSMKLQSDGKLLVAGTVYDGIHYRPVVARF